MPQGSEAADEAIRRLEDVARAAEAEIARLLRRMDQRRGVLASDAEALANNREVARQVRAYIESLTPRVERIAVQAAAQAASAEAGRLGLTLSPQLATEIDRIVSNRIAEIGDSFGDAAVEVQRAARIAITSSADLTRLIDDVSQAMRTSVVKAQAAVDSMAMASGRRVTIEDATRSSTETGEEIVFGYGGPVDSVTRPFCRRHHSDLVDRAYTAAALDRLDNGEGQPKPVSAYLGGYNCRHFLIPMTTSQAKSRGLTVVR